MDQVRARRHGEDAQPVRSGPWEHVGPVADPRPAAAGVDDGVERHARVVLRPRVKCVEYPGDFRHVMAVERLRAAHDGVVERRPRALEQRDGHTPAIVRRVLLQPSADAGIVRGEPRLA
jgi:hypothetical protein